MCIYIYICLYIKLTTTRAKDNSIQLANTNREDIELSICFSK